MGYTEVNLAATALGSLAQEGTYAREGEVRRVSDVSVAPIRMKVNNYLISTLDVSSVHVSQTSGATGVTWNGAIKWPGSVVTIRECTLTYCTK